MTGKVPQPIQRSLYEEPRKQRAWRQPSPYYCRPPRWVTGTTSRMGFAVEGV